jgi:hypothetical protein
MRSTFRAGGVLSVLLSASSAWAGDPALAESLFREGKALMSARDFSNACPKFAESYRQDPATGTLLALALCQEGEGKVASAWASFNAVIGRAQQEGRKDRVDAARARIAKLEPRLPRLTIVVVREHPGEPGPEVKRDGVPVPEAAWGSPTPIDPGEHVIEAAAKGRAPFRFVIPEVREGERVSVVVPVLAARATPVPPRTPSEPPVREQQVSVPAPAAVPPPRVKTRRAPERAPERGTSFLGWTGIGVGTLGLGLLGAGTYFTYRMVERNEAAENAGCSPKTLLCPEDGVGMKASLEARRAGRIASVLVVAGGAAAAGGAVLYFVGGRSDRSAEVSVLTLPHAASVAFSGRF